MNKREKSLKTVGIAITLILGLCLFLLLGLQVKGITRSAQIIPRIGSEPVYVQLQDGVSAEFTYTPGESMPLQGIELLLVNTEERTGLESDSAYIGMYVKEDGAVEAVSEAIIDMAEMSSGSWYKVPTTITLEEGKQYIFEFEPHGCSPYFMSVSGYELGVSLGFDVITDNYVTYAEVFYYSRVLVVLAVILTVLYIIYGRELFTKAVALINSPQITKIFNPVFLILLFASLSLKIYQMSVVEGVYISADSDGYMREAVNLVNGNGFSYEGIAGYSSHFANWPIIYPAMIAAVMLVTGTNAYFASKIVAIITIAVIFLILFAFYKDRAWIYALSFTNIGFITLCFYTWSEVPFVLFLLLFIISFSEIVKDKEPKAGNYVTLTIWGICAFLTRYFGIYLWIVVGVYWIILLAKSLKGKNKENLHKLLGLAAGGAVFVICAGSYLLMNKIFNGYPTGVARGTWWDDYATLTDDLINSLLVEIFNIFSIEVPSIVGKLGTRLSVWFILLVVGLIAYIIGSCKKKNVRGMLLIVFSAAYYLIFIVVRYRSSMDTFYFRFFAPATVLFVIGFISLIMENDMVKARFIKGFAVFALGFTLVSAIGTYESITKWKGQPTAFDIQIADWDAQYSAIPYKSVIIWNDMDYRSSWYRPDVYTGELFGSDTWDTLIERYYASDYICIKKADAEVIVESGGYDSTVTEKLKKAISTSEERDKYLVIEK